MKFLRFLLISSILISCTNNSVEKKYPGQVDSLQKIDLSADMRVDSILQVFAANPKMTESQIISIHEALQVIYDDKVNALAKIDRINQHMDTIENQVKLFVLKKRASIELKQKLLIDIQKLKSELLEIKPRSIKEIIQKPIPNSLKSLIDLEPGNYQLRTDKYHILNFFVNDKHEIFVAPVLLDSTTLLRGAPLDPKVLEQIRKLRQDLNN